MSKRRLDGLYDSGGIQGPAGPAGPQGPVGPQGPPGPPGEGGGDSTFSFDAETNSITPVPSRVDQFLIISESVPKFGYFGDTFGVNLKCSIAGAGSTDKLSVNEPLSKYKVLRVDTTGSGKTFLTGQGVAGEPILLVNALASGMKHVVLTSPDAGNDLQPVLTLRGSVEPLSGNKSAVIEGVDTIGMVLEDATAQFILTGSGSYLKTSSFTVGSDPANFGPFQNTSLEVSNAGVLTSKTVIVKDTGGIMRVQLENNGNINCLNLNNSTGGSLFYNDPFAGLTGLAPGIIGSVLRVSDQVQPEWAPPPSAIYWNSVPGPNAPTLASPWVEFATPFMPEVRGTKLTFFNPTSTRFAIQALGKIKVRLNYTVTVISGSQIDFSIHIGKILAGQDRSVATNYIKIDESVAAASIPNNKTSTLSSGLILSIYPGDELEFLLSSNFSGQVPILNLGVSEI